MACFGVACLGLALFGLISYGLVLVRFDWVGSVWVGMACAGSCRMYLAWLDGLPWVGQVSVGLVVPLFDLALLDWIWFCFADLSHNKKLNENKCTLVS